jgi:hypothetical protein
MPTWIVITEHCSGADLCGSVLHHGRVIDRCYRVPCNGTSVARPRLRRTAFMGQALGDRGRCIAPEAQCGFRCPRSVCERVGSLSGGSW